MTDCSKIIYYLFFFLILYMTISIKEILINSNKIMYYIIRCYLLSTYCILKNLIGFKSLSMKMLKVKSNN